MPERHQVLVVGGGFPGLSVTKALAHADADELNRLLSKRA